MTNKFNEELNNLNLVLDYITCDIKRRKSFIRDYEGTKLTEEERIEFVQVNAKNKRSQNMIANLRKIYKEPYFGRLSFQAKKDNVFSDFDKLIYVGNSGLVVNKNHIIVDWRSTIGQIFYAKNQTEFDFEIDGYQNNYRLMLKRNILIENSKIINLTDSFNNLIDSIENRQENRNILIDEFLLKVLERKREIKKVSNIISTIQHNQNLIITKDADSNFLVNGCAGSGKTMIMLHRLSYLLFNKKVKDDNLFIISPSKRFINQIDELSKELGLNKVLNIPLAEFFIYSLENYNSDFKSEKHLLSEYNLNSDFLEFIYSRSYYNKIKSIVENKKNEMKEYLQDNKIFEQVKIFLDIDLNDSFESYENFNDVIIEVKNIIYNLKNKVKDINMNILNKFKQNLIFSGNMEHHSYFTHEETYSMMEVYSNIIKNDHIGAGKLNASKIKLLDPNLYSKAKRLVNKLMDDFGNKNKDNYTRTILNDDEERKFEAFINKVNNLVEFIRCTSRKDSILDKKTINRLESWFDLQSYLTVKRNNLLGLIYDNIEETERYLDDFNEKNIFQNVILLDIKNLKKKFDVKSTDNRYKYYYYSYLLLYYFYRGTLLWEKNKLFSIDEFQDISNIEISLIMDLYPSSTYNLYGDFNQKISNIGLERKLDFKNEFEEFGLKENYRNTVQINDFINKRLSFNNLSMGLEGDNIKSVYLANLPKSIEMNKNLRVAIVFSRNNNFEMIQLKERYPDFEDIIYVVDEVKGTEFDAVYINENLMSDAEKYIAYSRGLMKLIILKDDEKENSDV